MPDGLLQWYDARTGEGRVVRGGREYPVHADEMEPRARVPGARVHFDVVRREGMEVAADVTLRSGTRVSRRQRRFGEMAGARPPREATGPPAAPPEPGVEIVARGAAAEALRDEAEEKLRRVMGLVDDPILYARVKLAAAPDPAVGRPASAKATLDVNGQIVRAHVSAATMPEAVERLETRLRDRLQHRSERERALRRLERVESGEWRHGQLPTERPEWFDRPPEEREVVRRKTFTLDEVTVDEAAFDMDMLDHDFHLFRDLATGDDALLRRSPEGGYVVQRLHPSELAAGSAAVDVAVDTTPPPTMALEEALDWLGATGERHVFFRDRDTGRGHVAYLRYDGHYGVITPGDEPAAAAAAHPGGSGG